MAEQWRVELGHNICGEVVVVVVSVLLFTRMYMYHHISIYIYCRTRYFVSNCKNIQPVNLWICSCHKIYVSAIQIRKIYGTLSKS